MNLGFTNDRRLPKLERRRKPFESPSGSSRKETEDSIDSRLDDKMGKPDYQGDISQSSWEWDIVTRDDMWVEGRRVGREWGTGKGGRDGGEEEDDGKVESTSIYSLDAGEDEGDFGSVEMERSINDDDETYDDVDVDIDDVHDDDEIDLDDVREAVSFTFLKGSSVSAVWKELAAISAKLQEERTKLRLKEEELVERERRLAIDEDTSGDDDEVDERLGRKKRTLEERSFEEEEEEMSESRWREKCERNEKNYKRLKSSFDQLRRDHNSLKSTHESLKKEFDELEKRNLRLKTRLDGGERNFGRTKEKSSEKINDENQTNNINRRDAKTMGSKVVSTSNILRPMPSTTNSQSSSSSSSSSLRSILDLLVSLCDWLTVDRLDQSPPDILTQTANAELRAETKRLPMRDRCARALPALVAAMPMLVKGRGRGGGGGVGGGGATVKTQLPILQFIHWSLFALDDSKAVQKESRSRKASSSDPASTSAQAAPAVTTVDRKSPAMPSSSLRHLAEMLHGGSKSAQGENNASIVSNSNCR